MTGFVPGYMPVFGWWSGLVTVISSQAYSQANIVIHIKQQVSKYVIKHKHIQALTTKHTNAFLFVYSAVYTCMYKFMFIDVFNSRT